MEYGSLRSVTHKVKIGQLPSIYLIVTFDGGKPVHVACKGLKIGSTLFGLTSVFCVAVSMALSKGTSIEDLANMFTGTMFDPKGETSNPSIPECSSVPDYIVRFMVSAMAEEQKNSDCQEVPS